jgi:hypothetical protein
MTLTSIGELSGDFRNGITNLLARGVVGLLRETLQKSRTNVSLDRGRASDVEFLGFVFLCLRLRRESSEKNCGK